MYIYRGDGNHLVLCTLLCALWEGNIEGRSEEHGDLAFGHEHGVRFGIHETG
jgi:hypothetical protein